MAYSPIEDKYLSALTAMQFPDEPPMPEPTAPEQAAPAGQKPGDVLVAEAGSRNLPEQAYSGRYPDSMKAIEPTVRERLASILQSSFEGLGMDRYKARQNAQTLIGGGSSNLPLNIGLADFVPFLGTGLQTEEAAIMGGESIESAKRGDYGTAALQAGGAAAGLIPGAASTIKTGKAMLPKAGEMTIKSMEMLGSPVMMNAVPSGSSAAGAATKAIAPASDIGFYSAVEKAALNVQRNSGSGQAFFNDITKGENVKLDEIKWMGLDDFLKGKKNVTKQEVQDFVTSNRLDVQEIGLSDTGLKKKFSVNSPLDQDFYNVVDKNNNVVFTGKEDDADYFIDRSQTKFGKYTLPGGENYREILLTLPAKRLSEDEARKVLGAKPEAKLSEADISYASRKAVDEYKSTHFDQANILAHIRVNDRVDADGKKMLLIEEVQSDWHQAGREKGYQRKDLTADQIDLKYIPPTVPEGQNPANYPGYYEAFDKNTGAFVGRHSGSLSQEQAMRDAVSSANQFKTGVPDAPFKDTWYQLALKRALRYAADNGYDRVGLTTGKQQAERYDLSKQIGQINARPTPDGKISLEALTPDMGEQVIQTVVKADELDNIVGKEIADKIRTQIEYPKSFDDLGKSVELSGLDLKVGGEGMKKYYDDVYPKFLEKYGKKWGASVGETQIKTGRGVPGGEPVRFIDITPEMRKSVKKGQPLAAVSSDSTVA